MSETENQNYGYRIMLPFCSCRDDNNDLTNLGKHFREFSTRIMNGEKPVDILKNLGGRKITRMCCRSRFLAPAIVFMIDTSQDRILDDRKSGYVESTETEDIEPGYLPYDFPILDNKLSR